MSHFTGGKLCTEDIELLKNWKYSWVTSEYGKLTDQGIVDVEGVADRMVKKLDEFAKNIEKDKLTVLTYALKYHLRSVLLTQVTNLMEHLTVPFLC